MLPNKHTSCALAVCLLVLATASACGGDTATNATGASRCEAKQAGDIYLGELLPLTGGLETFGLWGEKAMIQAINEINAAGGVHGQTLAVVQCDTATDPVIAAAAASELANDSRVAAVVGAFCSACTLRAMEELLGARKVLISPASTSPLLTTADDDGYLFRTAPSDVHQGRVAAAVAQREGLQTVVVLHRSDAYGTGLRDAFAAAFSGATHTQSFDSGTVDFASDAVDAAQSLAPDAVFLVGYVGEAAAILSTAADRGWNDVKWILPDGPKSDDLIADVAHDDYLVAGVLGVSPAPPSGPFYTRFQDAYAANWGADRPYIYTANTYDAVYLIALAMELADDPRDGEQIRDKLAFTHTGDVVAPQEWARALSLVPAGQVNYEGASGPVDFDANGDVLSDYEEWSITIENEVAKITSNGCLKYDGTACD